MYYAAIDLATGICNLSCKCRCVNHLCAAVTPVAAGVEARLKGNATAATANGPAGGRGRGEGRGRGGGRGGGRFTLRPPREETEGGEGGAGDRSSRGRGPRGKDLGKRHDNDRRDASGRG